LGAIAVELDRVPDVDENGATIGDAVRDRGDGNRGDLGFKTEDAT
jgi:hypothetical protein